MAFRPANPTSDAILTDAEIDRINLGDDEAAQFGASQDAQLLWETADADAHYLNLFLGASRNFVISEDSGIDWGVAAQTNPTLWIRSSDSTDLSDYMAFAHNQTNGVIDWGNGSLALLGGNVILANAAGPSLLDEGASATNPTLISDVTDPDTGIGTAGADQLSLIAGGVEIMRLTEALTGATAITVTQQAGTSGTPNAFTITGGAHTGITAATQDTGMTLDFSATKTWAAGAGPLANQFEVLISPPTYVGNAGGALTITDAYTLMVNGAPTQGANMTLTNTWALGVNGNTVLVNGHLVSRQSTNPTSTLTNTTLNAGGGSGAAIAVTIGSTDIAGSITITAGNGTPTAGIAGQIVFDVAYSIAPLVVILTEKDADASAVRAYVDSTSTGSFQITFGSAAAASTVYEFWYQAIG